MKRAITKEVDITTLIVKAGVRWWEDAKVDGVEDTEGDLIPCRDGKYWCPVIDIDAGIITNWQIGTTAFVHYKVCDDGVYTLTDSNNNKIASIEGYVPRILDLTKEGYGDYLILTIDKDGKIADWNADWNDNPNIDDFFKEED